MSIKTLKDLATTDAGVVTAVFSTLNVKDSDNDVTLPGAFQDGAPVRISAYGHASWGDKLPVGKGRIRMDGDRALLEGEFFMDTSHGRDTFNTVKGLGELGQWSYGYDVLDADQGDWQGQKVRFLKQLRVNEVSPVLLGAGIDTVTLEAKSFDAFSQQADLVLGGMAALITRAKAFGSQSTDEDRKAGRVLSAANRDRLSSLLAALREADTSLEDLLAAADPEKSNDDAVRAFARFQLAEIARSHSLTGGTR